MILLCQKIDKFRNFSWFFMIFVIFGVFDRSLRWFLAGFWHGFVINPLTKRSKWSLKERRFSGKWRKWLFFVFFRKMTKMTVFRVFQKMTLSPRVCCHGVLSFEIMTVYDHCDTVYDHCADPLGNKGSKTRKFMKNTEIHEKQWFLHGVEKWLSLLGYNWFSPRVYGDEINSNFHFLPLFWPLFWWFWWIS